MNLKSLFSVKSKLIITVSLILLAGFFVTNIVNYNVAKKSLRDNIINNSLPLTRDNIYSEIQRDLLRPIFVSSLMANDTFLKDWISEGELSLNDIKNYLSEIKYKYDFFASFFVSEKTKKYYYYKGILKEISKVDTHDKWYFDFLSMQREYHIIIDTNQAENNELTVFINHRLTDKNGDLLGVAGVGLKLFRITNLLKSYQVKYDSDVYMTDRDGIIQVHPKNEYVIKASIHVLEGIKDFSNEILSASQSAKNFEFDRKGERILLTVRYIPELDWFLIVEQNQNTALAEIRNNFFRNLAWGALLSLIIIITNYLTISYFQKRIELLAVTDELTGVYNRKEFIKVFERLSCNYKRKKEVFSIILFDIDTFKKINDSYGHNIGDQVIKRVAKICIDSVRHNDLVVRWGGDEFLILTSEALEATINIAQRISDSVSADISLDDITKSSQDNFPITISCGIAEYEDNDGMEKLIAKADHALYSAKNKGRNRIEVWVKGVVMPEC